MAEIKVKKSALALLGGTPVIKKPYPPVYTVGDKEIAAVTKLLRRGPLSDFIGGAGKYFLGGERVRSLEAVFCKKFMVKHAVSFNSATTALHGAVAALGLGPGDEVIVSPYTMSASATAILMNGAVPIFADIDERTFCLDPQSVRDRITKHTKAIMVVNLFGQAADFDAILKIAKEHNLKIIEDNAQSPGATWKAKYAGTIGDVGVFSFNFHKTMQSGEGGVLVTNSEDYALRAQLCRNHGESVVEGLPHYEGGPIFGSNYRMTEITATIAEIQLSRLDFLNRKNQALVKYLEKEISKIPGLTPAYVAPHNTHVYFAYGVCVNESLLGISRNRLVDAMTAEGFPLGKGYLKPLYLLPIFQERKAFNNTHFPFKSEYYGGNPDYSKGLCPTAERLYEKELFVTQVCQHPRTKKHIDAFIEALHKVLAHKAELQR